MLDETIVLALETIEMGKQAIIFAPSRASAEKSAEDISKHTTLHCADLEKDVLAKTEHPTRQCRRLAQCLKKGIAFHHAGLLSAQRELIETNFRLGNIKIICATPTLAAGLSMPAYRVIIKSLKRFSGGWGMDWIPVLEYMQMSGRAGRPEYEKIGQAITIARDFKEKEEIFDRYICGFPEDIYSKLAVEPVLRTYLLALISSGVIKDYRSMCDFFQRTFWAYQYKDLSKLVSILEKMILLLEQWCFIVVHSGEQDLIGSGVSALDVSVVCGVKLKSDVGGFFTSGTVIAQKQKEIAKKEIAKKEIAKKEIAKNIGLPVKFQQSFFCSTMLGKRVSQLYLDPLTARHILDGITKYNVGSDLHTSFSLLQMVSHTLEMRPLVSVKNKEQDTISEELNKRFGQLLEIVPNVYDPDYPEFMSSIKTALFFDEWISEKDEEYVLEKFDIKPGEIYAKVETALWLVSSAAELANVEKCSGVARELMKLHTRLEYGVKEELLSLLKLKGVGRVRARKLYNHGFKNLELIKGASLTDLGQILGVVLATDVKIQLGVKLEEVLDKDKGTGKVSQRQTTLQ